MAGKISQPSGNRTLRLGTRRSPLAQAQSGWVAAELERLSPGLRVELVGIETQGDRIVDIPLRLAEGKEFFVAELDRALSSGQVDLTVHSLKDLSLKRPKGIVRAAVPRREDPRDVVVFAPGIEARASSGKPLRIGTSSPRRIENTPAFLAWAIPGKPRIECVEIRGNVGTRLARLGELDAVVLAFAGLSRLQTIPEGVRLMVLPLAECPAAPGQGALAIECRTEDASTRKLLSALHDPATEVAVERERAILAEWGGGCHLALGATCIQHPETGSLLFIGGRRPGGQHERRLEWNSPAPPTSPVRAWNGMDHRSTPLPLPTVSPPPRAQAAFVASSKAVTGSWREALTNARVWVSGVGTWKALSKQGIWVEGCADGLGFELIRELVARPILGLPPIPQWHVLTHEDAVSSWEKGDKGPRVHATYRVSYEDAAARGEEISRSTQFFWASGSQFHKLGGSAPRGAHHACGPGRTAAALAALGMKPAVFPSVEEWKRWIDCAGRE